MKFSLLLSVAYLQYTLTMLALTVALFFLLAYLPGIVPFFSVSLISYCHMRICLCLAAESGAARRRATEGIPYTESFLSGNEIIIISLS